MLEIIRVTCNHESNPAPFAGNPVFGWSFTGDSQELMQKAYRLQIFAEQDAEPVYDSGRVESGESVDVKAEGFQTSPRERYTWRVQIWDSRDETACSEGRFEAAPEKLTADWIKPSMPSVLWEKPVSIVASMLFHAKQKKPPEERLCPATMLRREFQVKEGLVRAEVYATAQGIYQLAFNGTEPGKRRFAPEFTPYDKYMYYQCYDVTELLHPGLNACGALLGDGWWAGRIGAGGESAQYGQSRALLMQLELTYADGSRETVCSDEAFRCSQEGVIRYADLFIGEMQDHNFGTTLEKASRPGFDDAGWAAVVSEKNESMLLPQVGPGVTVIREIPAKEVLRTPKGEWVVDFGQNLAGVVRTTVRAPKGTKLTLEHSEVLDAKGNFLMNILGVNKDQTDVLVCSGEGEEVFEPRFTYHGFRYVRVTGLEQPKAEQFTALVLSSELEETLDFACSNEKLNRLRENSLWSQRANMISIPTDCPQREKAGWTADAQIFAPTACYNQDMNAFLGRWMDALSAEQLPDGQVPIVAPFNASYKGMAKLQGGEHVGAAGWSDACIFVPYTLYRMYGNREALEKHYAGMERYLDYVARAAAAGVSKSFRKKKNPTAREIENQKYLWNVNWQYGDWMAPSVSKGAMGGASGAKITGELTASIYYAYSVRTMSRIAAILGKDEDANRYEALRERIAEAIRETYLSENGRLQPDMQGSYVLALANDIIPEAQRRAAVDRLCLLIEKNKGCLDTGFLSTPLLLDVLTENGRADVAWALLYQTGCPSWLYEPEHGATTIWEAWDGIDPKGKVGSLSYNHYSFGCVFDWIYRTLSGISAAEPGFKQIRIQPRPDASLTWAKTTYRSPYGPITTDWEQDGKSFTLRAEIPCNTRAQIVLPDGTEHDVGSGSYTFTCPAEAVKAHAWPQDYPYSKELKAPAFVGAMDYGASNAKQVMESSGKFMKLMASFSHPKGEVQCKKERFSSADGTSIEYYHIAPKNVSAHAPCVVYYHGGAFSFPIQKLMFQVSGYFAKGLGVRVFLPEYRLSVNTPCGKILEDCYGMLEHVWNNADSLGVDRDKILIYGDSAGGALAAAVTHIARDRKQIAPHGQVLVYPVTDCDSDKYASVQLYPLAAWPADGNRWMWETYLSGRTEADPKCVVPMQAESFAGLPKAYVEVAEVDILRDEGIAYAKKLEAAGVPVQLRSVPGAYHGFEGDWKSPLTKRALAARCAVMKEMLNN